MTGGVRGGITGSGFGCIDAIRWVTMRSAAAADSTLPETAARNASPGSTNISRFVTALTVAVRGTPRTSAISPNDSPLQRRSVIFRPIDTDATPSAMT